MKKDLLNLEKTGFRQLSNEESIESNGGLFWVFTFLVGGIGVAAKKCVDDWQCFKDGLAGKPANHQDWHSK